MKKYIMEIKKLKLPFGIFENRELIQKLGFWWNPVEFKLKRV